VILQRIERLGNALPEPATLFLAGALAVMALSQVAASCGWSVEKTVTRPVQEIVRGPEGEPLRDPATGETLTVTAVDPATGETRYERRTETVRPVGLLSSDGLYWALSSLVANFRDFPPLAIVLVGMLGIGLAERTGFVVALLKATLLGMPPSLLTPTVFFVGVMSSMALDAGYVVLPPVAMALYRAAGRSPLVGLAAVFAGVSAGFSANLLPTALDVILAGFSTSAARLLDPGYEVAVTANWWLAIASTVLLVGVGWAVTALWVEPRLGARDASEGGPPPADDPSGEGLAAAERRGLAWALAAAGALAVALAAAIGIPGAPLHGQAEGMPRWIRAVVPLLFVGFFVPGLVFGVATGAVRRDRDVARILGETMAAMGPYIVLAFFAAQFIEYFRHSGLGEMLALAGGRTLARAELPAPALMAAFVGVVAVANLFIGSMSAKYAFFAPVFVPMFMQTGVSPELTQAAYRVGDSITNVITPLNPYVVVILVFMRRYVERAGIGTLVALMLPYTLAFAAAWTALLLVWMAVGADLGPGGPLHYAGAPAPG